MPQFYTYIYFDNRMLPYYVGKGSNQRAFEKHGHRNSVPPPARILIQLWSSEREAFEKEVWWISLFGRKDLGTGCLDNRDEGGKAPSKRTSAKGGRSGGREAHSVGGYISGRRNVNSGHFSRVQRKAARREDDREDVKPIRWVPMFDGTPIEVSCKKNV